MHNLTALLQLSDTILPIGGFAHSAGLETYVQKGLVHNGASAKSFICGMLEQGLHYTDGAFVSLAYDCAAQHNLQGLAFLDEECTAVKLPKEIQSASKKLGIRLLKLFSPLCTNTFVNHYKESIATSVLAGHYCIAFGILAFTLGIDKKEALIAFYYNAASGMITNSVKLIPLGQQQGQELLFSLHDLISQLATKSMQPDKELIGVCCTGFDIRSMQHERLYSRLYMS